MKRVFGVGLNKTGTSSLSEACAILGRRSFHHNGARLGPDEVTRRVQRAIDCGRHPFRYSARLMLFNAFFDVRAVERNFEYFDRHFPRSKFILHTRSFDAWVASRTKHVEYNMRNGLRTWDRVDVDLWQQQWDSQHSRVTQYFEERPDDLLTIDVAAGGGWHELCTFLDVPAPDVPFPFSNRAKS